MKQGSINPKNGSKSHKTSHMVVGQKMAPEAKRGTTPKPIDPNEL